MKRLIFLWVLLCSVLFAGLDWKIIQATRFTHPEWKEWMHTHERAYSNVVVPMEYWLCTPALALKPIFTQVWISVQASEAQQKAIGHAPPPNVYGFWHPVVRGEPYVFVPWSAWLLWWLAPCAVWFYMAKKILDR